MTSTQTPADTSQNSWVARMPAPLRPYLHLARLDRPIGTWLLYWPCVWSIILAQYKRPDWRQIIFFALLMFIGSSVMRGAGCAYNDIVDRDLDAKVARTRGRPIPSGQLSVRAAWIFLVLLAFIGLVLLVQFNQLAIFVGLASLMLVAAYPFMKRIIWWPQLWLGLTFNWGALVGWAAVANEINLTAVALYLGGIFWTLGYDTIYALQDLEDDALAGVKSSARALKQNVRRGVAVFYGLAVLCLAAALYLAHGDMRHLLLLLPVAGHFCLQVVRLAPDNPARCLLLFKSNREAGLLVTLACAGAILI